MNRMYDSRRTTHDVRHTIHGGRNLEDVWAIILAAGESKRMGFPKMLLEFDGITMIERVMSNVIGSMVVNAVVVLGSESEKIIKLVEKTSLSSCYNRNYKEGMLSSVKCGFRQISGDTAAVLVFQGDQPFITPLIINSLIEAFRGSDKGIVVPVYNKKRGHPLLVANKYFKEVQLIDASDGLRVLAQRFPEDVLEVDTSEPGIIRDFDTYIDYLEEINKNA